MKRAHRKVHRFTWLILLPLLLLITYFGATTRTPVPLNDSLPNPGGQESRL